MRFRVKPALLGRPCLLLGLAIAALCASTPAQAGPVEFTQFAVTTGSPFTVTQFAYTTGTPVGVVHGTADSLSWVATIHVQFNFITSATGLSSAPHDGIVTLSGISTGTAMSSGDNVDQPAGTTSSLASMTITE